MVQSKVISDNINTDNNSFLEYLHERNEFNLDAFKVLIFQIIDIIKQSNSLTNNEYQLLNFQLFKIYSYTINKFTYHHLKNNFSKIVNYDEEKMIYIYLPRFEFVIGCFINKDYKTIENYEDELGTYKDW